MKTKTKQFLQIFISTIFSLLIFLPFIFGSLGYGIYTIVTGSMDKTIPKGSIVVVEQVPIFALEQGDVITFVVDGVTVTHRITRIEGGYIFTKGDSNASGDAFIVENENIKGLVVLSIPLVGYFMILLSTPIGKGLIVLLLLFLFFASRKSETR